MLKSKLIECLLNLDASDIIPLHNEFCEDNEYWAERVEYIDALSELFYGMPLNEFLEKYDLDDFRITDKYFTIEDDGTFHSFNEDELLKEHIFYDDIYDMILYNIDYYINHTHIPELKEILEEINNE